MRQQSFNRRTVGATGWPGERRSRLERARLIGEPLLHRWVRDIFAEYPEEDGEIVAVTRFVSTGELVGLHVEQSGRGAALGVVSVFDRRLISWTDDSRGLPTWSPSCVGPSTSEVYVSSWSTRAAVLESLSN